jgi:hypothetical protein
MKKNMAVLDRLIRLAIAIVLIILLFTLGFAAPWNYVVMAISILFIITAIAGSCPAYTLLHMDTRQFKETHASYKNKSA